MEGKTFSTLKISSLKKEFPAMNNESVGAFALVLHSHIPFVRKAGEWPFGEEWLYEGLMETYIPLLDIIYDLLEEGIKAKFAISITPVLMEQLNDQYLLSRFEHFMDKEIERADRDARKFSSRKDYAYERLAIFYRTIFSKVKKSYYERYQRDLLSAFRKLQNENCIEVLCSTATHGYLPLLKCDSSIYAQVKIGIETYRKYFGKRPRGFWLPECGYRPEYYFEEAGKKYYKPALDEFLVEQGVEYFICDTHALEGMETYSAEKRIGPYGEVKAPKIECERKSRGTSFLPYFLKSGCAVFSRNKETGLQVWSGEWGYPGDGNYREFHKKDSDSGLQYWRITDRKIDLGLKQIYVPENTVLKINENADHFNHLVEDLLLNFRKRNGQYGIVVSPYDTELFGHWWFEGIFWLKEVVKKIYLNPNVKAMTLSEYFTCSNPVEVIDLPESSWGNGGKHYVWYNSETEWFWPYIYEAEKLMESAVKKYTHSKGVSRGLLNQAARELLLLQSSDWPFLVTTGQAKEYATQRFLLHYQRFRNLIGILEKSEFGQKEINYLQEIEDIDNLFPEIDYYLFSSKEKE
jgi:1,4-alpha-glucan branching enzyme